MIRELKDEYRRLGRIVESLELITKPGGNPARRRGRKNMDAAGRAEVSERMKRYWASRRARAATSGAMSGGRLSPEKPEPEVLASSAMPVPGFEAANLRHGDCVSV